MKKVLRNALKKAAERQSVAVQFYVTPGQAKKLGKPKNPNAKRIVLEAINEL